MRVPFDFFKIFNVNHLLIDYYCGVKEHSAFNEDIDYAFDRNKTDFSIDESVHCFINFGHELFIISTESN